LRRNRTLYAINRYYSPDTGRFTTHDPLTELERPERLNQPQGLNLYPYVMGAPTRYTDPDGLEWWRKKSTPYTIEWRNAGSPGRNWEQIPPGLYFLSVDRPGRPKGTPFTLTPDGKVVWHEKDAKCDTCGGSVVPVDEDGPGAASPEVRQEGRSAFGEGLRDFLFGLARGGVRQAWSSVLPPGLDLSQHPHPGVRKDWRALGPQSNDSPWSIAGQIIATLGIAALFSIGAATTLPPWLATIGLYLVDTLVVGATSLATVTRTLPLVIGGVIATVIIWNALKNLQNIYSVSSGGYGDGGGDGDGGGSSGEPPASSGSDIPEGHHSPGFDVYRAGPTFEVRSIDVKIKNGLVQPENGVSLHIDPAELPKKYGEPYRIESIPDELEIVPKGRPGHHELRPKSPMTLERFQELLGQVRIKLLG